MPIQLIYLPIIDLLYIGNDITEYIYGFYNYYIYSCYEYFDVNYDGSTSAWELMIENVNLTRRLHL